MSGASGQCTCSTVFAMLRLRRCLPAQNLKPNCAMLNGDSRAWALRHTPPNDVCLSEGSGGECLFDRQKIAPRETFLQRLAQQIRRMQRCDGPDLARSGLVGEPASASFEDPVLDIEKGLRRWPAHAHQHIGAGELDLAQ